MTVKCVLVVVLLRVISADMLDKSQRAQTIALAAICQSAMMIQQVSRGQAISDESLECLLNGIMVTAPDSVFDVYQSLPDLTAGSNLMVHQLSGQTTAKDVELTRYVAGIMSLSKRLLKNTRALNALRGDIDDVQRRLEHFSITDHSIIQNFADSYSKAISPIGAKIQVIGNPDTLRQPSVQAKVRAILLAGVRAAILWRQMGGQRRQFLFIRKQILKDAILFNKELTTTS